MSRQLFWLILLFNLPQIQLPAQTQSLLSRPFQQERCRQYDALNYGIQLRFDLKKKSFEGSNTIRLRPLNEGLQDLSFDQTELLIKSVQGPTGKPLEYFLTDSSIQVHLEHPLSIPDTVEITIFYEGKNPSDGLLFDEETEQWPEMVSSNSWPNHARYWFPCYDHPNDKATMDFYITADADLKVLANGKLLGVESNPEKSTKTWHWFQQQPHSTYLSMLAIGPFQIIEDHLDDLPINYWVFAQDEAVAREVFAVTPSIIDFFNKLYQYKYPFDKYDQVIGPHQGGGAEATSATILGMGAVRHKRPDQDDNWERIIAHEAAHQWWGDLITLRSWEHTWMNESFATYSDYLYTRAVKGEEKGALDLEGKKNQYLREARERYKRPIVFSHYNEPQDNFDSHTYPKGAIVLHMLRYQLGDEAFFRVLSQFLHKFEFQPVDTHDFTKTVKEVTGKNMDWFFDQWIFKPGHPEFDISYRYEPDQRSVILSITQVQDRSIGTPVYRLPVQIGITTDKGKKIQEIWITQEQEDFVLPVDGKPLLVRFDEGNWLLKEFGFEKSKEELLYQSEHDDLIGRKWAEERL